MRMSELIAKKRDGGALTDEEIAYLVENFTKGEIPDYQMSAMLMAIFFRGMDSRETAALTMAMTRSGDRLDISRISGVTADKHSTGGVGDKTSLVLCPMVASQGVKMAKMSGRGLGHTGGTIDKLESFPGFSSALSLDRFYEIVNSVGFAIAGQTANLDPADKKLYALRDVTATVDCMPLIVSSIMSKKLAAGADVIVLDVKTGSGAFMRTDEDAFALANELVAVGRMAGKRTLCVVTDMDEPLGCAVGNALEVKEAIAVLKGEKVPRLLELCLTLGAHILVESRKAEDEQQARQLLQRSIDEGAALCKLADFVEAQGGDRCSVYDTTLLPQAPVCRELPAPVSGYVAALDAQGVGRTCLHLGGGRETKESVIDLSVGVVLRAKVGDYVNQGDSLATIHAAGSGKAEEAAEMLLSCYRLSKDRPERPPFIRGVVKP